MSRASDVLGAGAPVWVSGKIYTPSDVVKSPADKYQLYVRTGAAGGGATDPANDAANYTPFGARAIKSIQRGVIAFANASPSNLTSTATITPVNTARAELRCLGSTSAKGAGLDSARVELTNSTTVTGRREISTTTEGNFAGNVGWELTEYY